MSRYRALGQHLAVAVLVVLICDLPSHMGWIGSEGIMHTAVEVATIAFALAVAGRAGQRKAGAWTPPCRQDADADALVRADGPTEAEIGEKALRRFGAELHDGPAQLISLALLRLEGLLPKDSDAPARDDFERARGALREALAEIRSMSAGLILPDLSSLSLGDTLRLAVLNHERRTATSVAYELKPLPEQVPANIKSCLYRFIQEALNNAYQHAGALGQAVRAEHRGDTLEVEVADAGPGLAPDAGEAGNHLGLLGMHERITALGGTLEIVSRPGAGTRLTARFNVAEHAGRGE